MRSVFLSLCLALALAACGARVQPFGPNDRTPGIAGEVYTTADGTALPLKVWRAEGSPRAVIVALHGFNMYSAHFQEAGPWWAARGVTVYAPDQRGFGGAPERGIWGGTEAMAADARDLVRLVRGRHPGTPVYLLGSSMGASLAIRALTLDDPPQVDGAILVAPAVWGGAALHPFYRFGAWLLANLMPWNHATGAGLRRRPSDNIEMLRANGRDPKNIFQTRFDAVYGVTQAMGTGQARAGLIRAVPLLVLYGKRDEIIPPGAVKRMLATLETPYRFVHYPDGWHMLLRDLQAETVWRDIARWISDRRGALPSGHEVERRALASSFVD